MKVAEEIIEQAEQYCNELIEKYDANQEITDIDICQLIEILRGRG